MSKVWLITGASRGLGRAFTEEALKAGHRVVATARNSEHLVEFASKFGQRVRTVPLDVTNEDQAKYCGSCLEVTPTTQLRNTRCKF
jgi:NADP-dependent 3-hydroxy acid dehydrogenase YdfG